MKFEDHRLLLQLSASVLFDGDSRYIQTWNSKIFLLDSETEKQKAIGNIRFYLFLGINAINDKACMVDECDQIDQDVHDAAVAAYDSSTTACFHDIYMDNDLLDNCCGDVLFFQSLRIKPEFRGKDFGLMVLKRIIQIFRSDMAIMCPSPLEDRKGISKEQAREKLRSYYARLGFHPVPLSQNQHLFLDPTRKLEIVENAKAKSKA